MKNIRQTVQLSFVDVDFRRHNIKKKEPYFVESQSNLAGAWMTHMLGGHTLSIQQLSRWQAVTDIK